MTAEQAFVAAFEAPPGYSIRAHRPADDAALLRIENRAAQLFRAHGYPEIADNPFADLKPGTDLEGVIGWQEDTDIYVFSVDAQGGQIVTIQLTAPGVIH